MKTNVDDAGRWIEASDECRLPKPGDLADVKSSFGEYVKMAECKTFSKAGLLIEACNLIDRMQISQQNQDLRQGNLYGYDLSLQEELVPDASRRGRFAAGVTAQAVVEPYRDVESLRGRNSACEPREAGRQVDGLFGSLLSECFGG